MENMTTKKAAMSKFMLAKQRKKEMLKIVEKQLRESYEKVNGHKVTRIVTM